MAKFNVKVFGKIKPFCKDEEVHGYSIFEDSKTNKSFLKFEKRTDDEQGRSLPWKEYYEFSNILEPDVTQQETFDVVVKPIIESILEGYNGTVFAYGQTGSGKTHTILGTIDGASGSGITPRSIVYIFDELSKGTAKFEVAMSHCEIYNNRGYDLLCRGTVTKLEDLPQIRILETKMGGCFTRNLSVFEVTNKEEALMLLELGSRNRAICETPMNPSSSRSHCIFQIFVTVHSEDGSTVQESKLNIVDLAGSETIGSNSLAEKRYHEALKIHRSLFHFKHVILLLGENKKYIPYRNSMLTLILNDSLGGRCLSTMVATLSLERTNIEHTFATCVFAEQVALVKSERVKRHTQVNPQNQISHLKAEVKELKAQLSVYKTFQCPTSGLSDASKEHCQEMVNHYLRGADSEDDALIPENAQEFQFCFNLMKEAMLESQSRSSKSQSSNGASSEESIANHSSSRNTDSTNSPSSEESIANHHSSSCKTDSTNRPSSEESGKNQSHSSITQPPDVELGEDDLTNESPSSKTGDVHLADAEISQIDRGEEEVILDSGDRQKVPEITRTRRTSAKLYKKTAVAAAQIEKVLKRLVELDSRRKWNSSGEEMEGGRKMSTKELLGEDLGEVIRVHSTILMNLNRVLEKTADSTRYLKNHLRRVECRLVNPRGNSPHTASLR